MCMLSSVTVCVLFGVCAAGYLYKDVGGVLDPGVAVQTLRHSPFHPLIQVAVKALPLKLNERIDNNRPRKVISLFEY